MTRSRIGCILALGILTILPVHAEQNTPKELLQYILEARKAGLKDEEIQQNASQVGWPAAVVTQAIRDTRQSQQADAGTKLTSTPTTPAKPVESDKPAPMTATPPPGTPAVKPVNTAEEGTGKRPERGVPDDYQIGAGDVLQISVWKEPDASVPSAVVRPDGKISMPMLKEVEVIGLTPIEAEKVITGHLTKFINEADVTVIVSAINSKKVYLVGGVKKEGPIPYTYRMTILQALSEAGGLTDYAKRKKIYVLRHENGRDYQLPFDYDAALKGERMGLNIPLMPGDTLVVPK
jgi:polysaccharide export outer membrane protein